MTQWSLMEGPISSSTVDFTRSLAGLTEGQLVAKFDDQPEEREPWYGYVHDARNLALFLNLQLNRLASELRGAQSSRRSAEICTQHHRAFRDLTGALVGMPDADFDRSPAEGEWPIRTVIAHITGAELGFSLLIDWAVKRQNGDQELPIEMPYEEMEPHYAEFPETGAREVVMGRYATLHRRVIGALMPLENEQLEALNVWWEGYEIPVWFRMHRFDAHLREHTIQVDKTLAAIGRPPTEAERLARLLHQSLADVEVALVSADDAGTASAATLAAEFNRRREQLGELERG